MDRGRLDSNQIFLVGLYFSVNLVGEMKVIILISTNRVETKNFKNLDADDANGKYGIKDLASLTRRPSCLIFVFLGI